MSRLNEFYAEFSEQNLFLQLLLGVIAQTGRVERVLPPPADDPEATAEPDAVDPFVAMLLGVVSMRARLLDLVEDATHGRADGGAAAARGRPTEAHGVDERPARFHELMR